MKVKNFVAGAAIALLGLPTLATAQEQEPVVINGSIIDWYYYGKDIHSSNIGWYQQTTGMGTEQNPYNFGLISIGLFPGEEYGARVVDFPIRNHLLYGNAGGVYTGDAYYSFFMHEVEWEDNMEGEYGSESWEIVVRKWDLEKKTYKQVGKLQYQPTDLCYDPIYDKVYGVFYISSGDEAGYKLGELDMETFKVKLISREAMQITAELRCLAINSKGELYGIDASGNVFKVSKTDGKLTEIGNVGFKSQRRMMSATFDLRTDKLYWIGYMNNGKNTAATDGTNTTATVAEGGRDTGVYEVDTETGKATLIGSTDSKAEVQIVNGNPVISQYGKMELTGIYVEGCFTKKESDLKIEMGSAPVQMLPGQTADITVMVKNIGTKEMLSDDYKVNFYANGKLLDNSIRLRDMDPSESREYTISYTAGDEAGAVEIAAKIESEKDQEARNNEATAKIIVLSNKVLPQVKLEGEVQENGTLKLTWADPDGRVVDGAENYVAFTYENLGAWTMYDGDSAFTQRPRSYNMAVEYENWNTPKAYIVFNPELSGIYNTGSANQFRPYNGQQYFASFFSAKFDENNDGHQVQNDDWMISPELSGKAQTISFMAKGYEGSEATGYATMSSYPEQLRVLYSTTDTEIASFTVTEDDTIQVERKYWEKYEFDLPEGAKYFAIQCVSNEGLVLMIDDIEYKVKAREVKGYKIYRNGVMINEVEPSVTSLVQRALGSDVFNVVAVYDDGDSPLSNNVGIDLILGIEQVETVAGETKQIFDLRGQRVSSMQHPGLYIVKMGGKTRKVLVK